jgi:hypothetical protein
LGTISGTEELPAGRREPEARSAGRERNSGGKGAEESGGRGPKRRRASKESAGGGTTRYFLTKATTNGTPELEKEMPDEHQALIAALKNDQSFMTVREWRAKVEIRKGVPVIGKEPVQRP